MFWRVSKLTVFQLIFIFTYNRMTFMYASNTYFNKEILLLFTERFSVRNERPENRFITNLISLKIHSYLIGSSHWLSLRRPLKFDTEKRKKKNAVLLWTLWILFKLIIHSSFQLECAVCLFFIESKWKQRICLSYL